MRGHFTLARFDGIAFGLLDINSDYWTAVFFALHGRDTAEELAATEGEHAGATWGNASLGEEDDDLRKTFIEVLGALEVGELGGGELAEEIAGEVGGVVVGVGKGSMTGAESGIAQSGEPTALTGSGAMTTGIDRKGVRIFLFHGIP